MEERTEMLLDEIDRMRERGFKGTRVRELFHHEESAHRIGLAEYKFGDGTTRVYVEATESHSDGKCRVIQLSEAVHLLQNVTEEELFSIGGREG